jgi:hypothetical protein
MQRFRSEMTQMKFADIAILGLQEGYALNSASMDDVKGKNPNALVVNAIKFYTTLISAQVEQDLRTLAAMLINA